VATHRERFDASIEFTETCWLWQRSRTQNGYGLFSVHGKRCLAHRWLYEQTIGPIPEGLEIDHLCRVRHCVNPDHLEAVTHALTIGAFWWWGL
jgi:hypothetical protein